MPAITTKEELFQALHGRKYTHRGVQGIFKHEHYTDRFGLPVHRLYHEPTTTGKKSKVYRESKRQLDDDWLTDLTDDIDEQIHIAIKLGLPID
jgi:hypothetical protein